ncbi:2-octaprenyl-6-methoxyphenyl hydroxylase [Steroidobacter agaridevorans]|uniref:2-octaprenyl-6-methoxyphenyl hydroxylase n=1 Tax=Steroidobacter agaridevorans TaxID=2695856 RepID=UPI00132910FB|nr:2-octaprenyl-6-methoxyphenyl hydroxylase [Steroidobacter agaridevorans]GFE86195.1 2-octaprenyl-6-methoxyphenyl hydroxylase [Steroidobacter agaridevorans]
MSDPDATPLVVDVAIAGGGLVGASLALALAQLQLKVALIEAAPFGAVDQPSFDDRSTAISNGSRRIFEALGVWPLIEREATAIRRIHVSDQGRFGFTRIDAKEQGLSALGYVVVNRVMGAALWHRLKTEPSITVLAPAKVQSMQLQQHSQRIECAMEGGVRIVEAKLAIAADGARSTVRQSAGIGSSTWDYEQVALVSNVLSQHFHDHVAYERFTNAGPLALLPLTEGRLGVVWTFRPDTAKEMTALSDAEFLARLQDTFGFRLGRFTRVGQRQLYPLSLTRSDEYVAERLAIVGNAAQTLHPIAGQGFNLGLRDAVSLAEVLADGLAQGGGEFDSGDGMWLQRYREWRAADRSNIVRFTDGLVRVFSQPLGPIRLLRNAGMLAFDLMPAAKDALSQLSLGAAGRVPRLARGAPLK